MKHLITINLDDFTGGINLPPAPELEVMPNENIGLKKLTKVLRGLHTDTCLFCKKKFNKGSNPMKKFCSHWCKVNFVYKYEIQ